MSYLFYHKYIWGLIGSHLSLTSWSFETVYLILAMQHLLHWPFFHFSLVSFSFFQHNTFTCKTTHRPSLPPSLSAAILAASTRYKFTKYFLNIHIYTQIFESKYYKNYTLLFLNYGISLYYFRSCMISPKQTYDLRIKNL